MKETLKRMYISGAFSHYTDEQIILVYGAYITKEDLDSWKQ